MQASLTFSFHPDATYEQVRAGIDEFFGASQKDAAQVFGDAPTVNSAVSNIAHSDLPSTGSAGDAAAVFGACAVDTVATGHNPGVQQSAAAVFAPLPAGASAPAADERDIEGLPWDERIHSESKVKNQDGTWKLRRGMAGSKKLIEIKAELQRGASTNAPAAASTQITEQPAIDSSQNEARFNWAREQTILVTGNPPFSQEVWQQLARGDHQNVIPQYVDWYNNYQKTLHAKMNEYGQGSPVAAHTTTGMAAQTSQAAATGKPTGGSGLSTHTQIILAVSKAGIAAPKTTEVLEMAGVNPPEFGAIKDFPQLHDTIKELFTAMHGVQFQ